jgi:hypothetical protein
VTYTHQGKTKAEVADMIARLRAAEGRAASHAELAAHHTAKKAWYQAVADRLAAELLAGVVESQDEVVVNLPDATVERPKLPADGTSTPNL